MFFLSTFLIERPFCRGSKHNNAKVDLQQNSISAPIQWSEHKKAVEIPLIMSQFSDGFVTMMQQRRNSGVLPTHELFLLKFLWL